MISAGLQEHVPPNTTHLGKHIVAEFFQADFEKLNNSKNLEQAMCDAAKAA